jgi:DNA-binding CsgD family transcriptional regulator
MAARPYNQTDLIADWMADNGGTPTECAHALQIKYETVKATWKRIRRRFGWQAQ